MRLQLRGYAEMEGKRERGREKKDNPMNNSSALSAVVLSGRTTTNYFVLFASVSFALGKDIRNPPWLTKPADIRRDSLASRMKESSLPRKEKKKKAGAVDYIRNRKISG